MDEEDADLSFKEYKEVHKKLTKIEVAFYETKYRYRSRLQEEETLAEIETFKQEMKDKFKEIKRRIEVDKINASYRD